MDKSHTWSQDQNSPSFLSDETVVAGQAWKDLKLKRQDHDFRENFRDQLTKEEKKIYSALIKAQRQQGDLCELKTQAPLLSECSQDFDFNDNMLNFPTLKSKQTFEIQVKPVINVATDQIGTNKLPVVGHLESLVDGFSQQNSFADSECIRTSGKEIPLLSVEALQKKLMDPDCRIHLPFGKVFVLSLTLRQKLGDSATMSHDVLSNSSQETIKIKVPDLSNKFAQKPLETKRPPHDPSRRRSNVKISVGYTSTDTNGQTQSSNKLTENFDQLNNIRQPGFRKYEKLESSLEQLEKNLDLDDSTESPEKTPGIEKILEKGISVKNKLKGMLTNHRSILEPKGSQEGQLQQKELIKQINKLQKQLKELKKQKDPSQKSKRIDINFLYASPLLYEIDKNCWNCPQLDFVSERRFIKEAIYESTKSIKFKGRHATKETFSECLRTGPRILHISCHGRVNHSKNEANLLLEDHDHVGKGLWISESQIKNLIQKLKTNVDIDLVFLAACHSQKIGEIFKKELGVAHVICIRHTSQLLDEGALQFIKYFYKELLNQKEICDAFQSAKSHLEFMQKKKEADIFMMLTDDPDMHKCCSIPMKEEGQAMCLSYHTQIKFIQKQSLVNTKSFREKQIQKLLNEILKDKSLVHIRGPLGIGKSLILHHAFVYLLKRKYFSGGVILLDLDFQSEISNFIRRMKKLMIQAFKLPVGELRKKIDESDDEEFREILIEIFQQNGTNFILKNQRFTNSKNKDPPNGKLRFLVGIDNSENLLIGPDKHEFINFIRNLHSQCPMLHLVISSNKGEIPQDMITKCVIYGELNPDQSAELFMYNSQDRELSPEDLAEIIQMDKEYPIECFKIPEFKTLSDLDEPENMKALISYLGRGREFIKFALAKHELFRSIIPGNPSLIIRRASDFANPLDKTFLSIKDVYNKLKLANPQRQESGDVTSKKSAYSKRASKSVNDLQKSVKESIDRLIGVENDPNSYVITLLLGCLQNGLSKSHLRELINIDNRTIEECLLKLEKLQFLGIHTEEKIKANSYIVQYIKNGMQKDDQNKILAQICGLYKGLLEQFFRNNQAIQEKKNSKERRKPRLFKSSSIQNETFKDIQDEIEQCLTLFKQYQDEGTSSPESSISRQTYEQPILSTFGSYQFPVVERRVSFAIGTKKISISSPDVEQPTQQIETEQDALHRAQTYKETKLSQIHEEYTKRQKMNQKISENRSPKDNGKYKSQHPLMQSAKNNNEIDLFTSKPKPSPVKKQQTVDNKYLGVSLLSDICSDDTSSQDDPIANLAVNREEEKSQILKDQLEKIAIKTRQSTAAVRDNESDLDDIDIEDISLGDRLYSESEYSQSSDNEESDYQDNEELSIDFSSEISLQPIQNIQQYLNTKLQGNCSLSSTAHFLILAAANYFLLGDYEYCRKICDMVTPETESQTIFNGNKLRIKALALEHIFIKKIETARLISKSSNSSLKTSQDLLKNALQVLEQSIVEFNNPTSQNEHGLALACFQLGNLDENYIVDDQAFPRRQRYKLAIENFEKAFKLFQGLNHLLGMYLSKKHMLQIMKLEPVKNEMAIQTLNEEVISHQKTYQRYEWQVGLAQSVSVARNQGEDLSLLTELALDTQEKDLYPTPDEIGDTGGIENLKRIN